MIPIYEQGSGEGIGHDLRSFLARFESLCNEHIENGRAQAFAFIFYDFSDRDFRKILKSQGVFVQLDRLAGSALSIFYLHSGRRESIEKFNSKFLEKLTIASEAAPPCVVFFKINGEIIGDIAIAQLDSADLVHGFHELYDVIARYIASDKTIQKIEPKYIKWIILGTKFVSRTVFDAFVQRALEGLF